RGTTAFARQALASVRVQRAVEVARLAVDVDVERIEAGAALPERGTHDGPRLREDPSYLDGPEALPRPLAVELGPPQRLVGIDVSDARDQVLVEQQPLDAGRTRPVPPDEHVSVELRVERVPRD